MGRRWAAALDRAAPVAVGLHLAEFSDRGVLNHPPGRSQLCGITGSKRCDGQTALWKTLCSTVLLEQMWLGMYSA